MNIFDSIPPFFLDEEIIKSFKSQEDFSRAAVELSKELGALATILINTRLEEKECFNRNTAIIYGLTLRLNKMYISIIENYCNKKAEIIQILHRCFLDSYINLLCLTKDPSQEKFDNYIKYSLQQDYIFYQNIEKNIRERGYEEAIESRMKESIENCFKISGLDMKTYSCKGNSWFCDNVYMRFKYCDRERLYDAYRMSSHSIHGSWLSLYFFDLVDTDDGFFIKPYFQNVDLRSIAPISLFYTEAIDAFINYVFPNVFAEEIKPRLKKIQKKFILLDNKHEKFIQISK